MKKLIVCLVCAAGFLWRTQKPGDEIGNGK